MTAKIATLTPPGLVLQIFEEGPGYRVVLTGPPAPKLSDLLRAVAGEMDSDLRQLDAGDFGTRQRQ